MRMSVRARLVLSWLLPVVPLIAIGVAASLAVLRLQGVIDDTRTQGLIALQAMSDAIDVFREEVVLAERARSLGDEALTEAARARSSRVLASLAVASAGAADPTAQQLAVLLVDYERLAGLTGPGGDPGEAGRAARGVLQVMRLQQTQLRQRVSADLYAAAQTSRATIAGLLLLGALMVGTIALATVLFSRSLVQGLSALERGAEALAAGDFQHRIELDRDDELGRLARAFDRMAARIAALNRMKSDFFANVSHDLKTPLTSILEAADLLDEEVAGPLNEDQRRLVKIMTESSGRLRRLVQNLLEFSRTESANRELLPGDVAASVDAVLKELTFIAEKRGVSLRRLGGEGLPHALVNRGMLEQVLMNLVGNAIKFSPRGGEVRVEVAAASADELTAPAPGAVLVAVLDQGPGVPLAWREKVFERFVQAPSEGPSRGGTGLGLSICRDIVASHGGRIGVSDAPGGGARVWFTLALAASTAQGPHPPGHLAVDSVG